MPSLDSEPDWVKGLFEFSELRGECDNAAIEMNKFYRAIIEEIIDDIPKAEQSALARMVDDKEEMYLAKRKEIIHRMEVLLETKFRNHGGGGRTNK